MPNKSRHLSVCIALPVLLRGGTEIQTLRLISVLRAGGYHVTLCCYYDSDITMIEQAKRAGAELIIMGLDKSRGMLHLLSSLIALFKTKRPDVIHIQYLAPGLLPIIASRFAGIRTVFATVHQPGRTYGWKAKLFIRIAAILCNAFICVSRSTEDSWFGRSTLFNSSNPNRKLKHFTIYNAVDVDKISRVAEANRCLLHFDISNKKVIGFVGRLRQEKGLDMLLDALPTIIEKVPEAVLIVVGDGPDRGGYERRAKGLGISSFIRWVGPKSPEEVYGYYTMMDVVAVPSRFEGFGLVAAEAMAAGLPVVATRVDGLAEVVEDGVTGYFFPQGDRGALAAALVGLLSDVEKARFMGQQGQARVRNHFSMEKFSQNILSAYMAFTRQ